MGSARTRCLAASRAWSSAFLASLSIPCNTSSRRAAMTGPASALPHMLWKQGARVCRSPARGSGGKRMDVHLEGESKMPSGRGCVARTCTKGIPLSLWIRARSREERGFGGPRVQGSVRGKRWRRARKEGRERSSPGFPTECVKRRQKSLRVPLR